jgi:predicted  nucleic acid-binding Zn-ribbon protein
MEINNMANDLILQNEIKDLTTQIDNLFDKDDKFNAITTRAVDPDNKALAQFHIFDDNKLAKISEMMPEINRATRSLGRKNTQATNKLMSLTMLADSSPYRVLRQCLSQIEKKRSALKENRFKIQKDKIELEKLQADIAYIESKMERLNQKIGSGSSTFSEISDSELDDWKKEYNDLSFESMTLKIDLEEKASNIADTMLYIEGCLKDIASFQSSYSQVCKNKGIPKDWDEMDAEKAEIKHHLRMAFLHGYRDIMAHGRLGMGTLEYLHQFGVHPHKAMKIITDYINALDSSVENAEYEDMSKFLDVMEEEFKEEYKKVLEKLGFDDLFDEWYMYTEEKQDTETE